MKHIVIVGGGFTGVTAAVDLANAKLDDVKITIIAPQSYFDYHPGLFHLLTGFSVKQLAIPYEYIFEGTGVIHEKTEVTSINLQRKCISTGKDSEIYFDYLVLATGSATNIFDMEEYKEQLHSVTNVDDVLKLRRSIHEMLTLCHFDPVNHTCGGEVIVIGGGPNGTETAAEVALLVKQIAEAYHIDTMTVRTSLYVSGDRVVPQFDRHISETLHTKLIELGVKVVYNKHVTPNEMRNDLLRESKSLRRVIIWSAGMKLAPFANGLTAFQKDKRGKIMVDEYLHAQSIDGASIENVFIGGDMASTKYSGYAQTAHYDGHIIARNIRAHINKNDLRKYVPSNLGGIIAMGRDWSIYIKNTFCLSGKFVWYLRRIVDLKSYLQILSLRKALIIFMSEHETWEEFDASARQHMKSKYLQK
ncbi:MAG: FAD-dependent oxidoreductase [Candidatus Roizmanbacteria bacterium]